MAARWVTAGLLLWMEDETMNQCTVRLSDDYDLNADGNVVVWVPSMDWNDDDPGGWKKTRYAVGADALLYSIHDVSPNAVRRGDQEEYHLSLDSDDVECGLAGNSNHDIRRFHGWRGTTNDNYVSAHGRRRIQRICKLRNRRVVVTVGRDMLPDAD